MADLDKWTSAVIGFSKHRELVRRSLAELVQEVREEAARDARRAMRSNLFSWDTIDSDEQIRYVENFIRQPPDTPTQERERVKGPPLCRYCGGYLQHDEDFDVGVCSVCGKGE